MRIVLCLMFVMVTRADASGAEETPTADEQKAIDALTKLGGKAAIDTNLHKEARVAVRFKELTDGTIASIKKYPQVGAVETFDSTKVTEKGFGLFDDFPHLWNLRLGTNAATDKTLAILAECKELRLLYVTGGRITDAGLASLKKLTRLEALELSGNKAITDAGMTHIKALERLEILYLGETQITDKGLFELASLEGLRTLGVAKTKVTDAAAMKFVDLMPNLRAVRR